MLFLFYVQLPTMSELKKVFGFENSRILFKKKGSLYFETTFQ